jgi:hypothetical protein
MKLKKMFLSSTAASVLMALSLSGQPIAASAAGPLTVQSEEAANPGLVAAMREMIDAIHKMDAAQGDFGGNKVRAIRDAQTAIHSLKKALYYRLAMDDAAIDRIP